MRHQFVLQNDRQARLAVALLATALGAICNFFPIPLLFGLNAVAGGLFSTLVALLCGPFYGAVSAALVFWPTLEFWAHPYSLIIFVLQGFWLGMGHRRFQRWLLELDLGFWILLGSPLVYVACRVELGLPLLDVGVVLLKLVVNSLATTAAAGLLLLLLPKRLLPERMEYSLSDYFTKVLVLLCVLPLVLTFAVVGRVNYTQLWESRAAQVRQYGEHSGRQIRHWVAQYEGVVAMAADQARSNMDRPAAMQALLESTVKAHPGLHLMYVADSTGATVAAYPPQNAQGESNLGIDFSDRFYFRDLQLSGRPVITNVFRARAFLTDPVVVVAHPFTDTNGAFAGFALAAVRIDASLSRERLGQLGGTQQVLVDGSGQVIDGTFAFEPMDRFTMEPAQAGGTVEYLTEDTATVFPDVEFALNRWDRSYLVVMQPVPDSRWELYTFLPLSDLKREIFDRYFWLMVWTLAALLFVAASLRLIVRKLNRPIMDLADVDMTQPDLTDDQRLTRWLNSPIPEVRRLVTHLRDSGGRLVSLAFHDQLTGLPNRTLLLHRLRDLLNDPRTRSSTALFFLDLDGFKLINDSLGHDAGDRVLAVTADRLSQSAPAEATVARIGGDEFAVLLPDCGKPEEQEAMAKQLLRAFEAPIDLDGSPVVVSPSIGVARGEDSSSAKELLRCSDLAMYEAKRQGKHRVASYQPGLTVRAVARMELEVELRRALDEGQFRLHYQPIFNLRTGSVQAMEALIRWEHPVRGLIPPGQFLPLAEETGLILPMDLWVLEECCRQLRAWQHATPANPPLSISLNLSARQFQNARLGAEITRIVSASGADPSRLELEITENAVMQDADAARVTLHELKAAGLRIAVDDFGTGYSSLSYLKQFPLDTLKIDRTFVRDIVKDQDARSIVRAMIGLARALDLRVITEGIETKEQLGVVRQLGAHGGQGYLFARPLEVAQASELLNRRDLHLGLEV